MTIRLTIELNGADAADIHAQLLALTALAAAPAPSSGRGNGAELPGLGLDDFAAQAKDVVDADDIEAQMAAEAREAEVAAKKAAARAKAAASNKATRDKPAPAKKHTLDDVRDALTTYCETHPQAEAVNIVEKISGVRRISEIPPKHFDAIIQAIS